MKKLLLITLLFQAYLCNAQTEDRWYTLTISGKPSGYYHENIVNSDSMATTHFELIIRISRLGSETVMDSKQAAVEDRQGNMKNLIAELLYSKQLI